MSDSVADILARARALAPTKEKKGRQPTTKQAPLTAEEIRTTQSMGPLRKSISAFFLCDPDNKVFIHRTAHYYSRNDAGITKGFIDQLYDEFRNETLIIHGHEPTVPCAAPYFCFDSEYRPKQDDHPTFIKQFYMKWSKLK